MIYRKLLILTLLSLFSTVYLFSQEKDFRSGAIKTNTGILLVWNEKDNYYTLEINGKEVQQTSNERIFFAVDGKFLQVLTVTKKSFLDKSKKQPDEKSVLEAHRDWEINYLQDTYKDKNLKVESSWQKLSNGKEALLWQYETPLTAGGNIKKQMYLTVVKGDHVFMLNSGTTDKIDETAIRAMLIGVMSTLQPNEKPIDLKEIQEKIRRGN